MGLNGAKTLTLDIEKIRSMLDAHRAEADRLQKLLDSLEEAGDFTVMPKARPGRPSTGEATYLALKEFVTGQFGEITSIEIKSALNGEAKPEEIRAAIARMIQEGSLEETQKAYGRRIGKYITK